MMCVSLPNIVTCARIILVVPYCYSLLSQQYMLALSLFAVAGFSDGVDGYLARRFGWTSRLGGFLDPLADKLILMSSFLVFYWLGDLHVIVFALLILRDAFILLSVCWAYMFHQEHLKFGALWLSKVNTVLQILMVMALLCQHAFPGGFLSLWTPILQWGVLAVTLWSWQQYMVVWMKRIYG